MNSLIRESLSQNFQNVEEIANEIKDKATDTFSLTSQTVDRLTTTLNQATSGVSQATLEAKTALTQTATDTTSTIATATTKAVRSLTEATNSVSQAAEKTKLSLDETLQKAEKLSDTLTDGVQDLIKTSAQEWIAAHPLIAGILSHPLWSIGAIFLILLIGWGLIGAIARFIEQAWLLILQSPFALLKKTAELNLVAKDPKKQLVDVLVRLENLNQEQDKLLQEVKEILSLKQ
jgi:exonuclease VII large subunit